MIIWLQITLRQSGTEHMLDYIRSLDRKFILNWFQYFRAFPF